MIGHDLGVADEHCVEFTQTEQHGESVALIGDESRCFGEIYLRVVIAFETVLPPPGTWPCAQEMCHDRQTPP